MATPQSTSPALSVEAPEMLISSNRIFIPEQVQANLAQYEAQYPDLFAILDQMGLREWPYTSPFSGTVNDESFANARLQTGMVVLISERLADALLAGWVIQENEKTSIIRSAVLHNSLKRLEVLWKTELTWLIAYSEAWYDALRQKIEDTSLKVWKSDIERASMMRKVIGHWSLKDFVAIDNGVVTLNGDRSLAEMIVHIASDMVGAKNPKYDWYTPNIQISNFIDRATFADFARAYPFLWKEWFALSDGGTREFADIANVNQSADWIQAKSYYDWQAIVYEMICAHIQKLIDPASQADSVEFLLDTINTNSSSLIERVAESAAARL